MSLLVAAAMWLQLGTQHAIVCDLSTSADCFSRIPFHVKQQLPTTRRALATALACQGAMALTVDDTMIAGMVVLHSGQIPNIQSAIWGGQYYQLPLQQQYTLSLWHELGHLLVTQQLGSILPISLTAYQHEWYADSYLLWRTAKEYHSLDLVWQQYHRRNMAVMADVDNMSHWSVPILAQLLSLYDIKQLRQFDSFEDFITDFNPKLLLPNDDNLGELTSLLKSTFATSTTPAIPNYLYWRRAELQQYLMPTLELMMGDAAASDWVNNNLAVAD